MKGSLLSTFKQFQVFECENTDGRNSVDPVEGYDRVLWRSPFLNLLCRLCSFSSVVIRVFLSRNDKNNETPSALLLTLSSAFTTNIQRISFHIMKPVLFVEPRSARVRRPPPLASLHIPLNKLTVSVKL